GNAQWTFPAGSAEAGIRSAMGEECDFLDASALAVRLLGDAIYANPLLLGYAWQKGWIPLGRASLERAIELNGVKVQQNKDAFMWGRQLAHEGLPEPDTSQTEKNQAGSVLQMPASLDTLIDQNRQWLTDYQNAAYAKRYTN